MKLPVFFLSLPFLLVELHIPLGSYFSYIAIAIFTLIYGDKFKPSNYSNIVLAYTLLILSSLFRIGQYSTDLFLDVGLLIIGCLPYLFCSRFKVDAKTLNIVLITIFIMAYGKRIFSVHIDTESLYNSDIGLESIYISFVIAMFALYWYEERQMKLCIINLILGILSGKRIVILAILVSAVLMLYFRNNKHKQPIRFLIAELIIIILSIVVVVAFVHGTFDSVIYELTGLSANHFTMGRQELYSLVVGKEEYFTMWGIGMGNTKELLTNLRLHNDILRIYIENGPIIFVLFFYTMLKKVELRDLPYYIFILIVYLTDNTLVYAPIQVMYILFINRRKHLVVAR